MPEERRITAEDILHWKPTDRNRNQGYRCYASRVMIEARRFEAAGDKMNAELRYEKMKAYCKIRGIEYPPGSTPETCLFPSQSWVKEGTAQPKDVPVDVSKAQMQVAKPIRPPVIGKRPSRGLQGQAAKEHGFRLWASRLLWQGKAEEAKAYCQKKGLEFPPVLKGRKSSGVASGVPGEPATGHYAEPFESRPPEPLPIEKLSVREQLMRQLAELDAAEREANGFPPKAVPAPQKPEVPPTPPVVAPEPEKPVKAKETPIVAASSTATVRKARINNFCLNPRMANIQFEDGDMEWSSMWIERLGLARNDVVEVMLDSGIPGVNAIWKQLPDPNYIP